jgi:hypothetical protein
MILLDYLGYIGSPISSALVIRTKHCSSKESEQLGEVQGMEKQIMAHGRRQNLKSLRKDLIQLYYKSSSLIHFRRTVLTSSGSNALSDVAGFPADQAFFTRAMILLQFNRGHFVNHTSVYTTRFISDICI